MAAIDGKWLSKEGLTYFWSKIKSIFTKQTETNVIANLGAKNMLYISNSPGYTATSHGRTFTVLSDGGIKITGTSSDNSNADFYVIGSWGNRSILLNGNKDSCLIRISCNTDYGYNQIRLRVMNRSTGSTANDTGVGTNEDVKLSHVITTVFVSVFPSVTLPEDGIVVYPMIRRAEITDNAFVPYAPTNRELYETRFASKTVLPNNVDLNDIKTGGIYNGVNSTGNSAVHMPVATGSFNFVLTVIEANEFIIQIFKQLNSAGDPNLYIRRFYIYNNDWDSWYQFTGTQV